MEKLKIAIVGAGNISNSRHIPAVLKNRNLQIVGIVSDEEIKISRTKEKYKFINNTLLINKNEDIIEQMKCCEWFMKDVDATIIGVPPKQHFPMTKASITLKKHTLIEKPMMMSVAECDTVIELAKKSNLVLNVMHSFQFSDGIIKLDKLLKSGELGKIESILELQLTNRNRRLPSWYDELPLGLYYDEAAHFFYGARRFGGELKVLNANALIEEGKNTPKFLQAQLMAGNVPVQIHMNFNSPICEWTLFLICENKIAIYDYFKDILVVLKNDNQHLAKDVLRNSISSTVQFWKGFIKKGFQMVSNNLLYGHDLCINKFANEIFTGEKCFELSPELGREVVKAMNEVVTNVIND